MPNQKVRLAGLTVQLNVYLDNGDSLVPAHVQPISVLVPDWPGFAATGVQEAIADMQRQIDEDELSREQAQVGQISSP